MNPKYLSFILAALMAFSSVPAEAQNKLQVLVGLRTTMQDFASDLNNINEDRMNIQQNVTYVADTYGTPESFTFNGTKMASFHYWLTTYCSIQLQGKWAQHTIEVLQQTVRKVDNNADSDNRWTFKAKFKREFNHDSSLPAKEDELTFTVIWNGKDNYLSLIGIEGSISNIASMDDSDKAIWDKAYDLINKNRTKEAIDLLVPIAEWGDRDAQKLVGNIYFDGIGINKSYKDALKWYTMAAEKGDTDAMTQIGNLYDMGQEIPQDYKLALAWFQRAAMNGHVGAHHNVGVLYLHGRGVEKNISEAEKWFILAAEKGFVQSQCLLGALYLTGEDGWPKSPYTALKWNLKGALNGRAESQLMLGMMYHEGLGAGQDYVKALEWYTKAAEKKNVIAMFKIGELYFNDMPQTNHETAFRWFEKAAKGGYAQAQNIVGMFYEEGLVVEKNLHTALQWYTKAAEQGYQEARKNRDNCLKQIKNK